MSRTREIKLRSLPVYQGQPPRVDRENLRLHDVIAMQSGVEALGHDCQADEITLAMMAALGNGRSRGIQGRFGHPGMSENAMGKKIMISSNFRVVGDKLLHDVELLEEARHSPVFARDPLPYILDMAEFRPAEIAESVVIMTNFVWTLPGGVEVDGDGERPEDALTPFPVMRPVTFYYVDLVSEGALTHDGLFDETMAMMFSGTSSAYADQFFKAVDEFRAQYDIPLEAVESKVSSITKAYLFSRQGGTMPKPTRTIKADGTPAAESGPTENEPAQPVAAAEPTPADSDTGETEPVEQAEASPEDALLEKARAGAAAVKPPAAAPAPEQPAESAAIAALREEMQQTTAALNQRLNKMLEAMKFQQETIEALTTNQVKLGGDPIITANVPATAGARLSASMGLNMPIPGSELLKTLPQNTFASGSKAATPEEMTLMKNEQRRQAAASAQRH